VVEKGALWVAHKGLATTFVGCRPIIFFIMGCGFACYGFPFMGRGHPFMGHWFFAYGFHLVMGRCFSAMGFSSSWVVAFLLWVTHHCGSLLLALWVVWTGPENRLQAGLTEQLQEQTQLVYGA